MNRSILRRFTLAVIFSVLLSLIGALGASASPVIEDDPGSPVQLSDAALAATLFEAVFNDHDTDAAARLISADAVISTPYRDYTGPRGLLSYLAVVRTSYLHPVFDVTAVTRDGNTVVIEWTMTATAFRVDPAEGPIESAVTMPGETTIVVDDGTVTALTESHGEVVAQTPADVTLIGGHVVWA